MSFLFGSTLFGGLSYGSTVLVANRADLGRTLPDLVTALATIQTFGATVLIAVDDAGICWSRKEARRRVSRSLGLVCGTENTDSDDLTLRPEQDFDHPVRARALLDPHPREVRAL